MPNKKMGLPFEYQKLPEYFDAYNVSADSDTKNGRIEQILRKHKTKTVLDLTCGTGSQVFYLIKHGYDVTGVDLSPALVKMAQKKAKNDKVRAKIIQGDMRTIRVGQFDAVITIANAVGHLTKAGFARAMQNIHRNLNPSGIYVFDILNLEAMTDEAVANLGWHVQKKVGDVHIHGIQCSTIDRKEGLLTSYDHVVLQKGAGKPELKKYHSSLQIYTASELKEMLARQGFAVLGQCSLDGSILKRNSLGILTVAQKH